MFMRRTMKFAGIFIVILSIMASAGLNLQRGIASPGIITVPTDYPTIQQAINAANPGDTVFVKNGTYLGDVLVNKTVNLIGENNQSTIIDGGGVGTVLTVSASGLPSGSADNVTIANFTLANGGSGASDSALMLNGVEGCNVTGVRDEADPPNGIWVNNSWYAMLEGNYVANNSYGIVFTYSASNKILNNTLVNNSIGILLATSSNNVICSNSIGDAISYAIYFTLSNYNNVSRNLIFNSYFGAYLDSSAYNNFRKNTFQYNGFADFWLVNSQFNCLSKNCITSNSQFGIYLGLSSNNTITRNFLKGNGNIAANIVSSGYNVFQADEFYNNSIALQFYNSSNNDVIGNNFTSNYNFAIYLNLSSSNNLYYNSFRYNTQDVYLDNSINKWDSGSIYGGGNYWDRYTGFDSDHYGIGNSSYVLDSNNIDHYPLLGLHYSRNFSRGMLNVISNTMIWDLQYFDSNSTVTMQVSNMSTGQTLGFARFDFPYSLINPTNLQISIDGGLTQPSYFNYSLYDNGTQRWIYVSFPMSMPTHTIDIIPEFPSFLILPIMAALLLAVTVYRRKRLHTRSFS